MSADITVKTFPSFCSATDRILPLLEHTNKTLTHDFCPWANRWVYWLKNPLWCLLLVAGLSTLCGIYLKTEALFITAIVVTIAGVGVAFPWLAMRGVDMHLKFDKRRSRVGQPVLIRLRIRNRWPWPIWGLSLVRGFALRDNSDTDEGVSLARVPGWATAEFSWPFVPQVRGLYPLMSPEIETGFPFGLYRACRRATVDGYVVVWPKTVPLAGLPDAAETRQSDDQLADRRVGDFGDMLGTRAFRSGDSLRRVHWAQTARQQKMIVCERQGPATTAVRVTLDVDAASHPGAFSASRHQGDTVELAVRVAASVCESLHHQHCCVELALHDTVLVAGESANSFHRLMDGLAQATLTDGVSGTSRRGQSSARFAIMVTTPAGLRGRRKEWSGQHVICVSHDTPLPTASAIDGAWISLCKSEDVDLELPHRWKRACNAV